MDGRKRSGWVRQTPAYNSCKMLARCALICCMYWNDLLTMYMVNAATTECLYTLALIALSMLPPILLIGTQQYACYKIVLNVHVPCQSTGYALYLTNTSSSAMYMVMYTLKVGSYWLCPSSTSEVRVMYTLCSTVLHNYTYNTKYICTVIQLYSLSYNKFYASWLCHV